MILSVRRLLVSGLYQRGRRGRLPQSGPFCSSIIADRSGRLPTASQARGRFSPKTPPAPLDNSPSWVHNAGAGRQIRVSGTEHYDPVRQVKLETAYRRWVDDQGQEVLKVAPLSLRYIFPQEMEALLHYNGFQVVERFGDWDKSPLAGDSRLIILVCRQV